MDFLEEYEEEFSVFLMLDEHEEDEDAANFMHYVEKMRQSGNWVGLFKFLFGVCCILKHFCSQIVLLDR